MSIDDLLAFEKTIRNKAEPEYFNALFLAAESYGIHKKTALYYVHKQHQMENTEAVK